MTSSSAVCDCCDEQLDPTNGYLLPTATIVLSVAYWESRFTLFKAMADLCALDERQLLNGFDSGLRSAAQSTTPWLVCEGCVVFFTVDRDEARARAQRGIDPPRSGAVDPAACAQYAAIGWEIVFGRWPASVQQLEVGDSCDVCGRTIYRVEYHAVVKRETLDRLRALGRAEGTPLGLMRQEKDGWISCTTCTTRMVETLRKADGRR